MSSSPARCRRRRKRRAGSGEALGLAPDRIYADYEEMAKAEAARPDGIEAVVDRHAQPRARRADRRVPEAGIHVICDKPLTLSLRKREDAGKRSKKSGHIFALTHNYTGYPLVRQRARDGEAGELGDIRLVQVEYPQDWLTEPAETTGKKQAEWRTDPDAIGRRRRLGDIGTHAYNLADFVSGLELDATRAPISARSSRAAARRQRADHAALANGARGALWASQVAPGNENGLRLRIYGTKGGLDWVQDDPNDALVRRSASRRASSPAAAPDAGEAAARRDAHPVRPSRGLSRRLRQRLQRGRARDQSRAPGGKPPEGVISRPSRTASRASPSSRRR